MPGGRPRKPDELKILDGTWRADRDADPAASVGADGAPEPPAHLKGAARKFWDSVVPGLVQSGVAKARDAAVLAGMCFWFGQHLRLSRALEKMPATHPKLSSMVINCGISWDKFSQAAARFGLNPSDRAKLRLETSGPKKPRVMSRKRV